MCQMRESIHSLRLSLADTVNDNLGIIKFFGCNSVYNTKLKNDSFLILQKFCRKLMFKSKKIFLIQFTFSKLFGFSYSIIFK